MTTAPSSSRLAPARRRAHMAKLVAAGAAIAGFGVVSVLVRGAHPGATSTTTPASSGSLDMSSRISQEAAQSGSFFGSGSVAPSQSSSPPQASTHTS